MRFSIGGAVVLFCLADVFGSTQALASDSGRGNHVDALMRDSTPVYEDPEVSASVAAVGMKVASASNNTTGAAFRFWVLNSSDVTAFSGPGGNVYVTTGLLRNLRSEDELAAVLGHEIAHINERHLMRTEMSVKMRKFWNVVIYVGMQAASAYAAALVQNALADTLSTTMLTPDGGLVRMPDASLYQAAELASRAAAMVSAVGGESLLNLYYQGYKDEYEFKADNLAVQYASRAGFEGATLLHVLERLGGSAATVHSAGISHLHSPLKVLSARTSALKPAAPAASKPNSPGLASLPRREITRARADGGQWLLPYPDFQFMPFIGLARLYGKA